jgi:perosamine synthetase
MNEFGCQGSQEGTAFQIADADSLPRPTEWRESLKPSQPVPDYPEIPSPFSRIPRWPVLSGRTFGRATASPAASILDAGAVLHAPSGRIAIALALRHMGTRAGDRILVPAYHCPSMIGPILWLNAQPVPFRVHPDTSVDLEDIRRKLDRRTRALLIVHYFGFPQDISRIRSFCDEHGLMLIEDCSHCFFGEFAGKPVGAFGDYATASPTKFFPVWDGGCLISAKHPVDKIPRKSMGLRYAAKASFDLLERAVSYRRFGAAAPILDAFIGAKSFLWHRIKALGGEAATTTIGPQSVDGEDSTVGAVEEKWIDCSPTAVSKFILGHASVERIVHRRRENYRLLVEAWGDLPMCRPLFPDLPDTVVPYCFPMLFDAVEDSYPAIAEKAVPVLHFAKNLWERVDASVCPTAVQLSRNLLQFPCHQELTRDEIQWMIETVRTTMTRPSAVHKGN